VLAVQHGKLDGIEGLVNGPHEGHDDLMPVIGEHVHMVEVNGLIDDNSKSILQNGNPLAELEVEIVVIEIRVGVEVRSEE
jgi:hypothetical protein